MWKWPVGIGVLVGLTIVGLILIHDIHMDVEAQVSALESRLEEDARVASFRESAIEAVLLLHQEDWYVETNGLTTIVDVREAEIPGWADASFVLGKYPKKTFVAHLRPADIGWFYNSVSPPGVISPPGDN